MQEISPCPNCGSSEVYMHELGITGGGYAANYLPDLGGFLRYANFHPAVCESCGLTRFFAEESARKKLKESNKWVKCVS